MNFIKNTNVKNAIMLGTLCSVSYLAVYLARNVLGAVTPQMIEQDGFANEFMGTLSSLFFICYAVGQLINGAIGDKIKARYMISFGLILAGICNALFAKFAATPELAKAIYGMTGFFLSMIYGPMTKVVAENTEPVYATRCSLGYTFASFLGTPFASFLAALMVWQSVFMVSSAALLVMGAVVFGVFLLFEKTGIVSYHQYDKPKQKMSGSIRVLIKHQFIKFILIAIITGVIRTTVVFWMPTYMAQYLELGADKAATMFTIASLVISLSAFISISMYEALKRNMDKTILIVFVISAVCFLLLYLVKQPLINVMLMTLAILFSNCAATMMWSRYCPSLRDTGMVSGATGFLDFTSYMAAAVSSSVFGNAATAIGWGKLILVWFGLLAVGVVVALPYGKMRKRGAE